MKISLQNSIKYLLIWGSFFLPTQAMFVFLFHFPNFVQMIYVFIIWGILIICFMQKKFIFKSIDVNYTILFLWLLTTIFISYIVNHDAILSFGNQFKYYVKVYSSTWDEPELRMLNWGIIRPWIFFIYGSFFQILQLPIVSYLPNQGHPPHFADHYQCLFF